MIKLKQLEFEWPKDGNEDKIFVPSFEIDEDEEKFNKLREKFKDYKIEEW